MSYKFIELLIIIGVALLILNKLFRILGQVEEDDVVITRSKLPKDATNSDIIFSPEQLYNNPSISKDNLDKFLLQSNIDDLSAKVLELNQKLRGNFNLSNFMQSCEKAIPMIVNAAIIKNLDMLHMLVDQRFIEQFCKMIEDKQVNAASKTNSKLQISDIYFFAHTAFIEISILDKTNNEELIEKWVFSKNTQTHTKEWYLSNITN